MADDDPTAETVDLLQHLIRNECVNDGTTESGHEQRNADLLADYLEGAGIDTAKYESVPGRESLVARIEGSDLDAPSLLLMGHTDVVPVNADRWRHDPFGGELIDGEVWGRGAIDMLNQTAAMAVTMRRLAEAGWKPRGTLTYLAVAVEEHRGVLGAKWMAENARDAIAADYCITETGGFQIPGGDGVRLPVLIAEKGTIDCRLRVHGTPAHASQPFARDNALVKAAELVRRIDEYMPETRIVDAWSRAVDHMGWPGELVDQLKDPAGIRDALAAFPESLGRIVHACTHTTLAPTIMHGGNKNNVIPDEVDLELDIRTMPGDGPDEVRAMLTELTGDLADSVEIIELDGITATESPQDTPLWGVLQDAATRAGSDGKIMPFLSVGATDNRYMRRLGMVGYGFALFSPSVGLEEFGARFHGDDERVDLESLELTQKVYDHTVRELLG